MFVRPRSGECIPLVDKISLSVSVQELVMVAGSDLSRFDNSNDTENYYTDALSRPQTAVKV